MMNIHPLPGCTKSSLDRPKPYVWVIEMWAYPKPAPMTIADTRGYVAPAPKAGWLRERLVLAIGVMGSHFIMLSSDFKFDLCIPSHVAAITAITGQGHKNWDWSDVTHGCCRTMTGYRATEGQSGKKYRALLVQTFFYQPWWGKGTANASWYTFQSQAYYSIEFQDWLLKGYFIMQCAYGRLPDH